MGESLFLVAAGNNACYAHLNLNVCFEGSVIPIYTDEPSAIIAYTLSSLEYQCVMNAIPTERVRGCRQRGDPSISELEAMVNERQKKRMEKIETELSIRSSSNHGKLFKENQAATKQSTVEYNKLSIEQEMDLDDLLHHIPKLTHVSKMEYLDEKKEYQLQLKKHGKLNSKSNDLIDHDNIDRSRENIVNDGSLALKFQFVDNDHSNDATSTTFSCHIYYPHQFR